MPDHSQYKLCVAEAESWCRTRIQRVNLTCRGVPMGA